MKRIISLALCFMLAFTLCQPAFAAGDTITWTGESSDNWNVAGNWNPEQVPGLGDTAVIPASTVAAVVDDTTSVTLDCSGEVSVESGENLWLTGTSYLKGNGKLSGDGNITIMVDNSELQWSGGSIEGNGTFTVEEKTRLVIDGVYDEGMSRPLVNNGQIMINEGELLLAGGSGGIGTFAVSDGAYLCFREGDYSIGGTFTNDGDISIWDTSSVRFNADYKQESTGTLALKVWGAESDQYCKLDVAGAAELGGILEIDFINDYDPSPGDSFEIVTCGPGTGEFSEIVSNMEGITLVPDYTGTGLTLTVSDGAAPEENVCEIVGGTGYPTLDDVLAVVPSGETIRLLKDIDYDGGIVIEDKRITFDLNGFTLNVVNNAEAVTAEEMSGLFVIGDAAVDLVDLSGAGELNVTGSWYGVYAASTVDETNSVTNNNTSVTVTNALGHKQAGVMANNAKVTVKGNAASDAGGYGVCANFQYAEVSVEGNVTAGGDGCIGVLPNSSAKITVKGSVTVSGYNSIGIEAYDNGEATVEKDITASGTGSVGINARGSYAAVGGNVTGEYGGIYASGSGVDITGDVRSLGDEVNSYGVTATNNSDIDVGGDVRSNGIGANIWSEDAEDFSEITIDGVIEAPEYIQIGIQIFAFTEGYLDPEMIKGYRIYADSSLGAVLVAEFAGGSGTEGDPYLVAHADQLYNLRNHLDKHFRLIEDIDLSGFGSGSGWVPIGTSTDGFTGTFDGDGHTISNLFIKQAGVSYVPVGLFRYTGTAAEICNLILESVDVTGCYYVGSLVGRNGGEIFNVSISGSVTGEWDTGGLAGLNSGSIIDSSFTGTVTGLDGEFEYGDWTGGLVGYNSGAITDCWVATTVVSEGDNVGGLVGENLTEGIITESYSAGDVTADDYTGGLVGSNSGEITACYSICTVSGGSYVGGLVGSGNDETVTDCYWDTETSGQSTSEGGTGKLTAEMKEQATYENWNFITIWDINTSFNNGYPFLRWQNTEAVTAPTAPQNFTATPSSGQVALSWEAPASNGGAAISGYEVSKDNGVTWVTASTSTSHAFTGLTNGTAYTFKVRAVNSAGNGAEASATATPTANVCKIGATEYAALDNALAALVDNTPTTITLLQNITDTDGISLSRKKLSIDLNGKTLTVNNSTGIGIEMELSSELNITGPGNLNVCGMTGLYLNQSIFAAAENVMVDITSDDGCGLGTDTACSVSMHGNISGARGGISAGTGNTITVDGKVTSTGTGSENHAVRLGGRGNTVQVGSVTVSAGTGAGIYVVDGGTVTVGSQTSSASVTGKGSGICTRQGSNTADITVYGDVTAGGGRAISATGDADIKVYGNVKSTSTLASAFAVEGFANSGDDISVSITGNVEGPNGVKYHGNNGTVSVGGNVTATGDASDTVGVYASYGSVGVTGNVASGGIGAEAGENGEITIDGVLTGNTYVKVYYAIKTAADKEPNTTKEGYHTYQKNSAVVWIKDGASATTYLLTVQNGTGGGSYLSGTPVNITANPPAQGKVFDKWTTNNGGSFANADSTSTTFTMPSGAVTVTATYKDAPVATYTVTVNGSYAGATGAGSYAKDAIVSLYAGNLSNYSFTGWTSPDGVPFANVNNVTTTFIMPAKNVTVTANWSYNGGGSSTPTTPPVPSYKADVKAGSGTEMTLPVTVDKNAGTASVDTGSRGLDQGGTIITIPSVPDVNTYSVGIPVPDLSTSDVQRTLTVNTDAGSVTVPSNMLTGVSGISGSKAEIAIGQGDKDNLPDAVKAAIGGRPLVQLSLSIDGKRTDWSNPDAPVTVSIPYTPAAAELANPESIVVWYIDGSGNAVSVPNGHYDPATGMVTFDTTHFSDYAVAYNKVSFNDVTAGVWYHKAISFIAARGITGGTGNGNYSPEGRLTRGQFIVMLMKAYDIAPDANPKDNFSDAGGTYYTGYLAAAKRLGISAGIGNNMFAPEKEITRQEMFTLLYNALKVIGQLPQGDSDKTLDHFSDAGQIDSWAKEAMTLLVKTGTIGGNAGKLNPTSTTTRAEMAQVLYNLLPK